MDILITTSETYSVLQNLFNHLTATSDVLRKLLKYLCAKNRPKNNSHTIQSL
jgi:hypothetical protein